jgi:hypothetical protein
VVDAAPHIERACRQHGSRSVFTDSSALIGDRSDVCCARRSSIATVGNPDNRRSRSPNRSFNRHEAGSLVDTCTECPTVRAICIAISVTDHGGVATPIVS